MFLISKPKGGGLRRKSTKQNPIFKVITEFEGITLLVIPLTREEAY